MAVTFMDHSRGVDGEFKLCGDRFDASAVMQEAFGKIIAAARADGLSIEFDRKTRRGNAVDLIADNTNDGYSLETIRNVLATMEEFE